MRSFSNRPARHVIARIGFRAISELLLSALTTSCRRRSWIGLPMLCVASLVSVLRHFFWSLLPWSSNVVFCRCDRHTSSAVSDSPPFSTMSVTIMLVTTADSITLSLSTRHLLHLVFDSGARFDRELDDTLLTCLLPSSSLCRLTASLVVYIFLLSSFLDFPSLDLSTSAGMRCDFLLHLASRTHFP